MFARVFKNLVPKNKNAFIHHHSKMLNYSNLNNFQLKMNSFNLINLSNNFFNHSLKYFSSSIPKLKQMKQSNKKQKKIKPKKQVKPKVVAKTDNTPLAKKQPRVYKMKRRQIYPVLSAMKRKQLIRDAENLGYIIIKEEKRYRTQPNKGRAFLEIQKTKKENTKKLLQKAPKEIKQMHEKERKKRNVVKKRKGWEIFVAPRGLPTAAHRKAKANTSWIKKRRQFGP